MKYIPLSKGFKAMVDDDDYEWLMHWQWTYNNGYATRHTKISEVGERIFISMHQMVIDVAKGLETDHINRNRLDNRKGNLRAVTRSENMRNKDYAAIKLKRLSRKHLYKKSSRVYPLVGGIHLDKRDNTWSSYITHNSIYHYIGRFKSQEAARAALEKYKDGLK